MKEALKLSKFIDKSYSSYHCVIESTKILEEKGFKRINLEDTWKLKKGEKYYLTKGESSVVAFTLGEKLDIYKGFKIFAAHTDSPALKIKPNPIIKNFNLLRLNTEVYGGPILNTWFDRPLSLAGVVYIKGSNSFKPEPKIINIDKDLMVIPNLAIHQNRDVNNGVKIDKQKQMLPIISTINNNLENILLDLIKKELNVDSEDILDFDLYTYIREKSNFIGVNEEILLAPRIDNIASVYAGIEAISTVNNDYSINLFIGYDNEEIGSATKQGADSNYLANILERIILNLGYDRETYLQILNNSYIISADGAHAVHPSHVEKSDITNQGLLNEGVLIKSSSNQRYTSEAESISILKSICKNKDIKLQYFVNNSNEIGGTTIGPISSTHLDIRSIDIGIPMLAMHSSKELCGVEDIKYLVNIAKSLFEE